MSSKDYNRGYELSFPWEIWDRESSPLSEMLQENRLEETGWWTLSEWLYRVLQPNMSVILWFLECGKQALQIHDKICKAAYGLQGLARLHEPTD